jgi:hypothetical protein
MALIYIKQGGGPGRLSGGRRNADQLGKGPKFRQGPYLHFLHHPVASVSRRATAASPDSGLFLQRFLAF